MGRVGKYFLLTILFFTLGGCLGLPENAGSDELMPETASEDVVPEGGTDEFAEFDEPSGDVAAEPTPEATETAAADEMVVEETPQAAADAPVSETADQDEFAEFEQAESQAPAVVAEPTTQNPPVADEFDLDNVVEAPVTEPSTGSDRFSS